MGEGNEELGDFKLDQDHLDALRLEAQSVSPKEQADFQKLVREAHHMFKKKMGQFISPRADSDIAKRFILVDAETYDKIGESWIDDKREFVHKYTEKGDARAFIGEGNFVVSLPVDLWERLSDENKREFMDGRTEDEARKFVNRACAINTVLHEITHLYQSTLKDVPLWFREVQAFWVAQKAAPDDLEFHTPEFDARADFYQTLLDKYGNEVHGLALNTGKGRNLFMLYQVKKEFTPEVQEKIFPEYSGTV